MPVYMLRKLFPHKIWPPKVEENDNKDVYKVGGMFSVSGEDYPNKSVLKRVNKSVRNDIANFT